MSSSSVVSDGGIPDGLRSVNFKASGGKEGRSTEGEEEEPRLARDAETSRLFPALLGGSN